MEMLEYLEKGLTILSIIVLVVGILQAVTEIQKQTFATAPKIFAIFLVIIFGGLAFIRLLTKLFQYE